MAYCYIRVTDRDNNIVRRYGGNNRECRLLFDSFVRDYGLTYFVDLVKTSSRKIIRHHSPRRIKRRYKS